MVLVEVVGQVIIPHIQSWVYPDVWTHFRSTGQPDSLCPAPLHPGLDVAFKGNLCGCTSRSVMVPIACWGMHIVPVSLSSMSLSPLRPTFLGVAHQLSVAFLVSAWIKAGQYILSDSLTLNV